MLLITKFFIADDIQEHSIYRRVPCWYSLSAPALVKDDLGFAGMKVRVPKILSLVGQYLVCDNTMHCLDFIYW